MTDFTTTAQNIQLASQALNKLTNSLNLANGITTTSVKLSGSGAFNITLSSGKLMISTGSTNLFSIDTSGNVIALGTITPSSPP